MKSFFKILSIFLILYLSNRTNGAEDDIYKIGTGIADITGPAAEINMVLCKDLQDI